MHLRGFLSQCWGYLFRTESVFVRQYELNSQYLNRRVRLSAIRPRVSPNQRLNLVICLDGQDFERMKMVDRMASFFSAYPDQPLLMVGIHAADRLREYGTSGRPDYQGRGDLSKAHQDFVTRELLPWLNRRYCISKEVSVRAIMGFSLGGLHAFDLAWQRSDVFGAVGVFSGALWWRSKPFNKKKPDANRIVHDYVSRTIEIPSSLRVWLMAGTEDEKEDRNNNGIIDAIDDTVDLKKLLKKRGFDSPGRLTYLEKEGGRHEPETWGEVLPDFLHWLFKR